MTSLSAAPAQRLLVSATQGVVVSIGVIAIGVSWAIASLAQGSSAANGSIPFLLLVAVIVCAVVRESAVNKVSLLSPFFVVSVTYLIMFAAVPLADVHFDNPIVHHALWETASWLVLLGYVLLYVGYRLVLTLLPPNDRGRRFTWSLPRSDLLTWLLLGVAFIALFVQLIAIGGLSTYVIKFSERHTLIENGPLYIKFATLGMAGILLLLGAWLSAPSRRRALLFILALPPVLLASALAGQRWRDLTIFVAIVAAYHFGHRRIPKAVLACLLVLVAGLFVYYGSQRSYIGTRRTAPSIVGTNNFYRNYVSHQELSQFRNFVLILEGVPGRLPFQHGATFLSIIPGAPFPVGGYPFSSTFYPELLAKGTSIPPSFPGELFMNFGFIGVVVGMTLLGLTLGILESAFKRRRGSIGVILVYAYSIVPLGGLLRGDFATFGGYYMLGLLPLLAAILLAESRLASTHGHRGPEDDPRPPPRLAVAATR
jgi:oligosaccharide repeat unit polymerase